MNWKHNLLPQEVQEELKRAANDLWNKHQKDRINAIREIEKRALKNHPQYFIEGKPIIQKKKKGWRFGEDHHRAKLSDSDVVRIVRLHKEGLSMDRIARHFNCGKTTVWKIVHCVIRGKGC